MGKKLKAYSFVGYRYLVERLGPWSGIMGQVNAELRAEQQTQGPFLTDHGEQTAFP